MHTQDMAEANIEKIGQLFPNCLTERLNENGQPETAIDFDKLKQELSKEIVEGNQERYQFTWPGKREAMRLANTPTNMTLRPDRESSVNFDTTENLYIEGDNLEVLKLLRENYLGKVKMIYIDPPYNTGNDFVYGDDFSQTVGVFKDNSGMFDENGNMLLQNFEVNSDSNGRFHTDWLNMLYPRLKVAKDLLTEDGIIFISIDDNEVKNLKNICDEVFGEQNFAAQFLWTKTSTPPALAHKCRKTVEYILCYEKNRTNNKLFGSLLDGGDAPLLNAGNPEKQLEFPIGSVCFPFMDNGVIPAGAYERTILHDEVKVVNGKNSNSFKMSATFKWGQATLDEEIHKGTFFIVKSLKFSIRFQRPFDENSFKTPNNNLNLELSKEVGIGTNESAVKELDAIDLGGIFDFPKPTSLVKYLVDAVSHFNKEILVMDFFSGSGTTADAVMRLNKEDGGNRHYILIQLPERINPCSNGNSKGFDTICQFSEERIRRAGAAISNNVAQGDNNLFSSDSLDTGFRVLKLDTSNMQDVYYTPEASSESTLFEDNVKPDRTPEDLLFQVMLECNIPLSAKIEAKKISGKDVFSVNDGYLIACFDEDINEAVITEVAKQKPYYFIMRDKSLSSDQVADNFEQIFNAYSKDTIRRIL